MGLLILFLAAGFVVLIALVMATMRESIHPRRRATGWALGVGWPVDPAGVDGDFEEWTLARPGGVRLPVWDVIGHRKDGPILLLVHGFGRSRLTWLPHLEEWRNRGSRVVMIDLRGHGEALPDGAGLGDADVDDLVALVEVLSPARRTGRPVVVVGRSLGASVGILAAAEAEAIHGVMAVAPYETLAVPLANRIRLRGLPVFPVVKISILLLGLRGRRARSTRGAASLLTIPLLVVQGDADQISPPGDARAIAEAASKGRFELVRGAGHGDHWDLEPERLDAAVDEFFDSLTPGGQVSS